MRPINKGPVPGEIKRYQSARPDLKDRLGDYCSYCERYIASSISVEHKLPKSKKLQFQCSWHNLLLACSNCNSSKNNQEINQGDYLWPDLDNTFSAFNYDNTGRISPQTDLNGNLKEKAIKTLDLLGLNKLPSEPDGRCIARREAWQKAERKKQGLATYDTEERRQEIIDFALERGFFSIWMTVFKNDPDIKKRLITAFTGTAQNCFDAQGNPVPRPGGQL